MSNTPKERKETKEYYLEPVKFVRDIVLGYVYLTEFDLEIIDTLHFQRLKDVRQLTCQHVYPSARHTRFEHSLGVMELTRQAISNLNENKFISSHDDSNGTDIFDEQLKFNAALAALLHDIGHCPFSHLGETEFDKNDIFKKLMDCLGEYKSDGLEELLKEIKEESKKENSKGAKHELLSCVIILDKFGEILSSVKNKGIKINGKNLSVDFELIIRSILGLPYTVDPKKDCNEILTKNVIVNLINSKILDMDKLDYIIRDAWYTGIGAPRIDTRRLFKNMHLNNKVEYKLAFTHRAVPALQNMIESRDELYMYVYNHHTAVFSDFMCSYIFRRLTHNEEDLLCLINKMLKEYDNSIEEKTTIVESNKTIGNTLCSIGIISKDYIFSPTAIIEHNRSDSDLISLFNTLYNSDLKDTSIDFDAAMKLIISIEAEKYIKEAGKNFKISDFNKVYNSHSDEISTLLNNLKRTHKLIRNYNKRAYLKPWWKTNSEFTNFMEANFRDDRIREKLCDLICNDNKEIKSDEFRSQLAKNVSFITKEIYNSGHKQRSGLLEPFENDEFFVIQRSARFLDTETIGKLDIALKSNEILGVPHDAKSYMNEHYIKSLTNVIPQRDYYSMYAKNSFYIFSKPLSEDSIKTYNEKQRNSHYRFIEQIFIFVATTLINDGPCEFEKKYPRDDNKTKEQKANLEEQAHSKMYKSFEDYYFNDTN